jgi:hypothetical protein
VTIVDLTARKNAAGASANGGAVALTPPVLNLDDENSPADVVDLLFLDAFARGVQPHARHRNVSRPKRKAPLCPSGARLLRAAKWGRREARLYAGDGWTLRVRRWYDGSADLTVTAVDADTADAVLAESTRDAVRAAPPTSDAVPVGFWHKPGVHPIRRERLITSQPWDRVRGNYAPVAAAALDRLMRVTASDVKGRLVLLYGPPGTGKTTVLRTLAAHWHKWCQMDCVLDPERLFADPSYLVEVAMGADGDKRRWRLLLLEDCDELIGGGARHASGQALSRLLNLTDGMLGQGRDVLVAITTNEDVSRLHPAVVRPGRCLARIELGPLPFEQARAWLGRADGIGPGGATLARLYALRDGTDPIAVEAPEPAAGLYL